ncbi:DNA polymerase/3'-5' exonuclease PolX [Marinobacter orientalis]|uniref:DNA polymerase beta n=1 Tax=Marinobacter orientalis TaxID=1928859 RepID=A0A7Y0RDT1_9GAMM|nr:DNA polymerase/3'-5' exonuclease PolX [Marinobacter orientalis]NMT64379.1 DNA polymerase/3'-5' exonuclease PolX [Marinobacter orientalis]TGX50652.1 DNA polymerase/3'-5' exonuclease PolX [Marinobacter orientalis]
MHNAEIARKFHELADLLEIQGANPFRVRAYRNAASIVEGSSRPLEDMVAEGEDLSAIKGIGNDLAGKIAELVETGNLPGLEALQKDMPAQLSELMRLDQLGPRRIRALNEELGVSSLKELKEVAEAGKIRKLAGFGARTESRILEEISKLSDRDHRTRLAEAEQVVGPLVAYLDKLDEISRIEVAGSYRRRKETVGDLDILVASENSKAVMERFTSHPEVAKVASKGKTRATVFLKSDLQVDLRVVKADSFGAALHYFTGSRAHNVAIRKMAGENGLKINEYGVYRGRKRIAGKTETEVFEQVNLPWIPPELRENKGEIEAAREGRLPDLVEESDIRGDLHMHTSATDGRNSLEEMVEAARRLGYEYIAITDHSRRLTMANGLDAKRLRQQIADIDKLNDELGDIRVLKGIEVDILEDGKLDLPDEVLNELDITVCSIHSRFELSEKQQTERVLRAMDNPRFNILGHPTGRLINTREAYQIDLEAIIEAAAERGCCLELNAQPSRLDLAGHYAGMLREAGVLGAVSTDAHATDHLRFMHLGVAQARRGWMEKKHLLNTRTLKQLQGILAR